MQKQRFKIKCSSIIENSEFETGTDLADIYFAMKNNAMKNNAMKNKVEIIMSETEYKIQRLSKINPSIISLVKLST